MRKLLRISTTLFGILALVVLVLWIVGGRTSVRTAEITIAARPEQVFPFITKPDKIKQWMEGVVEIESSSEDGRNLGTEGRIVIEVHGQRFEVQDEVVRFEKNRLLEVQITSPMFVLTNLYELSDGQGKTHLQQTVRTDYTGFGRVFAPFLGGEVQRTLDADLQRLKQLVEAK